jgi:hypothetical protein
VISMVSLRAFHNQPLHFHSNQLSQAALEKAAAADKKAAREAKIMNEWQIEH